MKYNEFDVAPKIRSDQLAELLRGAGIRLEQREVMRNQKALYVIWVHPDDLRQASKVCEEAEQREREALVRTLEFVRRPYNDRDMLLALEPNEAGYHEARIYHGEAFDPKEYRVVPGGWDHEHCYLCYAKVLQGEEWWATHPTNFENEIGLCFACYGKLFEWKKREPNTAADPPF